MKQNCRGAWLGAVAGQMLGLSGIQCNGFYMLFSVSAELTVFDLLLKSLMKMQMFLEYFVMKC